MALINNEDILDKNDFDKTIKTIVGGLDEVLKKGIEVNKFYTESLKKSISEFQKAPTADNLGALETNKKQIKESTEVVEKLTTYKKELLKIEKQIEASEAKETKTVQELNKELYKSQQIVKEKNTANKRNIDILSAEKGSLIQLEKQLSRNIAAYRSMSEVKRNDEKAGVRLLAQIQKQDAEVKKLNATIGNFKPNVGNYKSGFDGLGMSIAQLTREAPAFANSMQTGFMAISNNLPIFADQINMLKERNKQLNAEGIKTPSIFKSVLSSFLSWNTLISVGITLLTVFGKDIVTFIGNLFKTKSAIESVKKAQEGLNDVYKTAAKDASDEIGKLETFYKISQNKNRSLEDRKKAVDQLQLQFPKHFKNLTDEEILIGKGRDAYIAQRVAIMELARTKVVQSKIDESVTKQLENEMELEKLTTKNSELIKKRSEALAEYAIRTGQSVEALTAVSKKFGLQININDEKYAYLNKQMEIDSQKIAALEKERKSIDAVIDMYISKIKVLDEVEEKEKKGAKEREYSLEKDKLWMLQFGDALEKLNKKLGGQNTALEGITKILKEQRKAADEARKSATLLTEAFVKAQVPQFQTNELDELVKKLKEAASEINSFFTDYGDSINSLANSFDSIMQTSNQKWTELIAEFDAKITEQSDIVDEQRQLKSEGLANSYNSEKSELEALQAQRDAAAEKEKENAIIMIRVKEALAAANMLEAVSEVFAADAKLGTAGIITAIASVAAMVAEFYAYEQEIESLEKLEDGGEIDGASHKEGGIDVYVGKSKRPTYNVEGGEFVVSKRNYRNAKTLTNMINDGLLTDSMFPLIDNFKKNNEIAYSIDLNTDDIKHNTKALDKLTNNISNKTSIVDGKMYRQIGNKLIITRLN